MIPHIAQRSWVHTLLGDQNFEKRGFLHWWYRLTSLREPEEPTLHQRDLTRRSKILSALALFLALTLLMVAYVALSGPNKQIITTVFVLFPTIFLCLLLNRFGRVHLAGIVLTVALVGGMYLTLITTAWKGGGLTPNDKDILYLPFFGEMVAAALLPTFTIFLIAALNTALSLALLMYAPHTAAFSAMLVTGGSSITFRLVEIHVFVALVLWMMATWTQIAVRRADRASELARLSHDLQEATSAKLKEREHLEQSIAQISQVHARVANGEFTARVNLQSGTQDVFWQIAVPLNNLLARHQQALHEAEKANVYLNLINLLVEEVPSLQSQVTHTLSELRAKGGQAMTLSTSLKG